MGVQAQHTFSIVAVDPVTGEVGSAGATCLTSADCGGCGGAVIISDLVPGRGAINAQAQVCIPNSNLNIGTIQMMQGDSPEEVLQFVLDNDNCQFGIPLIDNTALLIYLLIMSLVRQRILVQLRLIMPITLLETITPFKVIF